MHSRHSHRAGRRLTKSRSRSDGRRLTESTFYTESQLFTLKSKPFKFQGLTRPASLKSATVSFCHTACHAPCCDPPRPPHRGNTDDGRVKGAGQPPLHAVTRLEAPCVSLQNPQSEALLPGNQGQNQQPSTTCFGIFLPLDDVCRSQEKNV